MNNATNPLPFHTCSSILESMLIRQCGKTHSIESISRRCEKGFFIRPKLKPDIATPCATVYALRGMSAWQGVKMDVGIFFEGFALTLSHEGIEKWMAANTTIDWFAWSIEGEDLFIRPRSKHRAEFSAPMLAQLERLAGQLERQDLAMLAVYVEILIPIISPIR